MNRDVDNRAPPLAAEQLEVGSAVSGRTLDDLFGAVIIPNFRHETERTTRPKSLQVLNAASAPPLRAYLGCALQGLGIAQVTHEALPILWALDAIGEIWIAMEEVVSEEDGSYAYPLSRAFYPPEGYVKLGHPSLVGPVGARIAGEIVFDPEFGQHGWVISNKSGRFGFGVDRIPVHLDNVADVFKRYDIALDIHFIPHSEG